MRFNISKIKTFVFYIYLLNKNYNEFTFIQELRHKFCNYELDDCRKKVLSFINNLPEEMILPVIKEDEVLSKIYELNYSTFEEIYSSQIKLLEKRKSLLEVNWKNLNQNKLKRLFDFFESKIEFPKVVNLHLGNIYPQGLGFYHYKYDYIDLLDKKIDDDSFVEQDLKIILHEIAHFLGSKINIDCDKETKEWLIENLALSFAPYGILFENLNRIKNKEFYSIVKSAIENNQTINQILPKLIEYSKKEKI